MLRKILRNGNCWICDIEIKWTRSIRIRTTLACYLQRFAEFIHFQKLRDFALLQKRWVVCNKCEDDMEKMKG